MVASAVALIALSVMEIVLGIDNIVFIAILTARLPRDQQVFARRAGLALALVTRLLLLLTIRWILGLTKPIVEIPALDDLLTQWEVDPHAREHIVHVSWRDIILLVGGLFLIGKATVEIHERIEGHSAHQGGGKTARLVPVIIQIGLLDIVFSLDSVITAVGMAKELWVMMTAVLIAVGVMLVFAGRVSDFVERHPTVKILALSFLILIGVMLVAEAIGTEISKGYIYFAMAFALLVEFLNLRMRLNAERKDEKPAAISTVE